MPERVSRVVNGRVWTGDAARPWAEAVALDGDRIHLVGATADVRAYKAKGIEIDAGGGLVVPGFIDSHLHLIAGGFRLTSVQLRDANSRVDLAGRLAAFARTLPRGTWITGGDWDHQRWGGELPSREWIDYATPEHPVWISRFDGHMGLANTVALYRAGVTAATSDISGGEIVRDRLGAPTGLFRDNATTLITRAIPDPSPAHEDAALVAAMRYLVSCGVTSVHHMGSIPPGASWEELAVFQRAHARRALSVRIYATVPLDSWARLSKQIQLRSFGGPDGRGDEWLRVGALKGFVDGSLGSHTAAFHDPYSDAPGDCGLLVNDVAQLREWMTMADRAGLQLAIHAIGDRANTLLLDLFDDVRSRNGSRDRRGRVEHAQHLRPADVPRFRELGVIASMQPSHAIDDGRWAERVIGVERSQYSYPWKSLLDAGATIAFGSDWFVAPPTPLEGIAAAVTRQRIGHADPDGWIPSQRIALSQALLAYTSNGAYASFEENVKGRISPGFLADLVVLDRDLFPNVDEAAATRITATIVGGRLMFPRTIDA